MFCGFLCARTLSPEESDAWLQGNANVHVTIKTPARYQLTQGIKVAIDNVADSGRQVTVKNVVKELEEMQDANDVKLPYYYTRVSTTGKNSRGFLKGYQKQKYAEFEAQVAAIIKRRCGSQTDANAALDPIRYKTEKEFVDAYVKYMMDNISESERLKWVGRIDGLGGYKRQKKDEARKIYRAAKK